MTALVVQHGQVDQGHYTAHVSHDGITFVKFNDGARLEISTENDLNQGQLFFYVRIPLFEWNIYTLIFECNQNKSFFSKYFRSTRLKKSFKSATASCEVLLTGVGKKDYNLYCI